MSRISNEYVTGIIILSCCSALSDFMTWSSTTAVFSRDRIIHIIISVILGWILIFVVNTINFEIVFFKVVMFVTIVIRLLYVFYKFYRYSQQFYGTDLFEIVLLSCIVLVMSVNLSCFKTVKVYQLFALSVILIMVLVLLLSFDKYNVLNLYMTYTWVDFSCQKIFVFFDMLTISLIIKDRNSKLMVQKNYLIISSCLFMLITVIQGLCIRGELLYSLSPLQSIVHIISSNTIKRCDYIFTILFTVMYFASIILYGMAIRCLCNREKSIE